MINDKILNEIYKHQSESEYLTTKKLKEYGLTQYDITKLVESSKLKRIKRGYYQITLNNPEVSLTLLSLCIKNQNYNKVFEYIDKIAELNDETYNKDNYFILYLLSMITTIPDKYKEYIRHLRLQDIRIDFNNKRYINTNILLQNNIRKLALNKKFVKALKVFTLLQDNETENTQNTIIEELLSQAKEYQIHSKRIIYKYATEKEYQKLAEYLSKEKEKCKLNSFEEYILHLSLEILDIKKTNTIPKVQIENTEYLYEAINGKNYNLALSLYIKFLESKKVLELGNNPLYILLYDINEYIKQNTQKEQESTQPQEIIAKYIIPAIENIPVKKETTIIKVPSTDIEFIKQKLPTLKKQGIMILKPMSNEKRQEIHKAVHRTSNIASFTIGQYEPKRIVLRYIKEKTEDINFIEEVDKINKLYKNKNYQECIRHGKKLLKIGKPPAIIYAKMGLAYLKVNAKDKAIDYLTVATELNKEIGNSHDFSDLIASLQGLIPEEDKKPKVNIKSSEFKTDLDNYYGIENIEEIAQLILNGMSIESICQTIGLERECEGIIALIFARECYFQCRFDLGDKYLKIAERSKNKSKLVLNLLEEVRKNKKFYAHRIEEGSNHKILTLTPNLRKN